MSDLPCTVISGAGGEIGRALAVRFARLPSNIALIDRDLESTRTLEQDLPETAEGDIVSWLRTKRIRTQSTRP